MAGPAQMARARGCAGTADGDGGPLWLRLRLRCVEGSVRGGRADGRGLALKLSLLSLPAM